MKIVWWRTCGGGFSFRCPWCLLLSLLISPAAAEKWASGEGCRTRGSTVPEGGQAGFTLIPPGQSGVLSTNHLAEESMASNLNLMLGSGVAAGDFDGDGRCDLYFPRIEGTNVLYRNLGGWRFEEMAGRAGVACPNLHSSGAVFADFDGDADLDLFVTTLGSGTHCFRNDGKGNFADVTRESGLASQTGGTSMALADVNGDGALDLYVCNYGAQSIVRAGGSAQVRKVNGQWQVIGPYAPRLRFENGRIREVGEPDVLYLNDGHGHFRALPWESEALMDEEGKPLATPWDYGLTVQMRDVNGDGAPDIYVCNDFQSPDRFWLNDGHGHFRLLPKLAVRCQSHASMGVDFADIDRDGALDFMVVEMAAHDHQRRMCEMSSLIPGPYQVGQVDARPETPRNTLFWNRGDGTYAEVARYAGVEASGWSWQPVFLDVDLDGYEDLLVITGYPHDVQDLDAQSRIQSLGKQSVAESRKTLFLYPSLKTSNLAYRNVGNCAFSDFSEPWHFDSTEISQGIALADLDEDGDLDAVINCLNAVPLLYRNETSAPRITVRLRGAAPNTEGIGARITLTGGGCPPQTQEILCGGRYLSGDQACRVFAANGEPASRFSLTVLWRAGHRTILNDLKPNTLVEVSEPPVR